MAFRAVNMKLKLSCLSLLLAFVQAAHADQKLAVLAVGSEVYSNVTVTTVTATDIYFIHAKGMGNAKLKQLSAELQKQFNYDATKARVVEQAQAESTAVFLRQAATNRVAAAALPPDAEELDAPTVGADGDLVAAKLYATAFRGQRPPSIVVAEWLTPAPDVTNKFVLVDFWATWAAPARAAIPYLNELQSRFKDKLVVIGLSNESAEEIQKLPEPRPNYSIGTDPQMQTMSAFQLQAIPHSILIDPAGIVRYEGHSKYLDAVALEKLISKYSP